MRAGSLSHHVYNTGFIQFPPWQHCVPKHSLHVPNNLTHSPISSTQRSASGDWVQNVYWHLFGVTDKSVSNWHCLGHIGHWVSYWQHLCQGDSFSLWGHLVAAVESAVQRHHDGILFVFSVPLSSFGYTLPRLHDLMAQLCHSHDAVTQEALDPSQQRQIQTFSFLWLRRLIRNQFHLWARVRVPSMSFLSLLSIL